MRDEDILVLCFRQLRRHAPGVPTPRIDTAMRGRCAGRADGRRLRFNRELLDANPDEWPETVAHELAHHVCIRLGVRGRPHGREWRAWCRRFGGTGERCHRMETTPARGVTYYEWETPSGDTCWMGPVRHKRAIRGHRSYHVTRTREPLVKFTGKTRRR